MSRTTVGGNQGLLELSASYTFGYASCQNTRAPAACCDGIYYEVHHKVSGWTLLDNGRGDILSDLAQAGLDDRSLRTRDGRDAVLLRAHRLLLNARRQAVSHVLEGVGARECALLQARRGGCGLLATKRLPQGAPRRRSVKRHKSPGLQRKTAAQHQSCSRGEARLPSTSALSAAGWRNVERQCMSWSGSPRG